MSCLKDRDLSSAPSIPDYYRGKTIFITGGSGFIGKVLIEKLLYACTDLDRIYLLLRNKKGVRSEERLQQFYSLPCFDRLRAERPDAFNEKVFVVTGDVGEEGLGLSQEDRALLVNKVNVVFHVAASVRFDDPLTYAAKLNLQGTKEMVDLAKEMKDLSVFVHVSTSYSNTNMATIDEVMYPPHADWRETLAVCREIPEHTLRVLTPKYLGVLPNTYTFTKQLAEHVVYEERGRLPVIIIRPSIVISSLDEPVSGWIENFNGPAGIMVACGKGIMRSIHTKADLVQDYIPVDICAKHMIVAAWLRGIEPLSSKDDIDIYNCASGNIQQIFMEDLISMAKDISKEIPLDYPLWSTGGKVTSNETLHYIKVILQHLLPAVIVDMFLWLLGRKPMLVRVQRRIYTANIALKYYLHRQWTFANDNFVTLRSKIKPEDVQQFYYDLENIEIHDYFRKCCWGGRRYLLKERDEDVPKARAHLYKMMILDKTVQGIFFIFLAWWTIRLLAQYYGDGVQYFFSL